MSGPNDGTRSLFDAIMSREVIRALDDWRQSGSGGVLVGTLALNHHAKPRYTDKITVLVPEGFEHGAEAFDRLDRHSFSHRATGIQIWALPPAALRLTPVTADRIRATAVASDGIEVASRAGLIAILLGDRRARASADIVTLLQIGAVDLTGFGISDEHLRRLDDLRAEAVEEDRRAAEFQARTGEPCG